jgi:hypothetical protein
VRTSAELVNTAGHPAMKAGAAHKKRLEGWISDMLQANGVADAPTLARQIILLLDGSFAVVLPHRDPSYMETAGGAAFALVDAAGRHTN